MSVLHRKTTSRKAASRISSPGARCLRKQPYLTSLSLKTARVAAWSGTGNWTGAWAIAVTQN